MHGAGRDRMELDRINLTEIRMSPSRGLDFVLSFCVFADSQ